MMARRVLAVVVAGSLFYELTYLLYTLSLGYAVGDYRDFWGAAWQVRHSKLYQEGQLHMLVHTLLHSPASVNATVYYPQPPLLAWGMQALLPWPIGGEYLYWALALLGMALGARLVLGAAPLGIAVATSVGPAMRVIRWASDTWLTCLGAGLAWYAHRQRNMPLWCLASAFLLLKPTLGAVVIWALVCSGGGRVAWLGASLIVAMWEFIGGYILTNDTRVWTHWLGAVHMFPREFQADQANLRGLLDLWLPDGTALSLALGGSVLLALVVWRHTWRPEVSAVLLLGCSPYAHTSDWAILTPWLLARGGYAPVLYLPSVAFYLLDQWVPGLFLSLEWLPCPLAAFVLLTGREGWKIGCTIPVRTGMV